jgi:DNA-binding winged helix-turn-helix (wHTH) protein/Tol biopolymer transport system component
MQTVRLIRFGPFELDVRAGSLRKHGIRIRLQDQSFQILLMLLDRPGEVVFRDDIRLRLWPNNTIVEFDHSINSAIKRLRNALGESAGVPRFLETVAKRGYRFVGEIERTVESEPPPDAHTTSQYRLLGKLGEGGMGVVWDAEDLKLGRHVAVKFLPLNGGVIDEAALRRFEQEARAASALNHPNICTVHGLEDFDGKPAIVMELVEGETLAARLARGPLALAEALRHAIQIASALAEAHRRAVVHRDLKPANVMLTKHGVKVLDFGLAKIENATADSAEAENGSQDGAILGTLHYMSPEQVQGRTADARSDIFSLGVVLYEMLSGRRPFDGENSASLMAAILEREPAKLTEIPAAVERTLERCLAKDPERRWQSARDLQAELEWSAETSAEPGWPRPLFAWMAAAAVLILALGALTFMRFREVPAQRQRFSFQIAPPEGQVLDFQLSPDGRFLAIVCGEASTTRKIFVRSLDGLDTRLLTTLQGLRAFELFWSLDGEQIVYQWADKLYRIPQSGGPAVVFATAPEPILGGVWLDSGNIVFGTASGLFRLPSSGGAPIKIANQHAESLAWLPGGRFLFTGTDGLFAGSLDGGKPVRILADPIAATYVPSVKAAQTGHLLFIRGNTLSAQAFDTDKLKLQGGAIPLVEPPGTTAFTVSTNGILIVGSTAGPGGVYPDLILTWLDRNGRRLNTAGRPFRPFYNEAIRLSPNGSQAIVQVVGKDGVDLWIADLNLDTFSRFTFNGADSGIWSPEGRKVLWAASDGSRYLRSADGSGKDELLYKQSNDGMPTDWSSDGRLVAFAGPSEMGFTIWLVPTAGDRKPFPYNQPGSPEYWAQISPDNHWMAYDSEQFPEPQEVFVESIPPGKGKWQISAGGGDWPIWRRDGREIFYRQGTKLMAMPIRLTERSVETGKPLPLFEISGRTRFQVSRDGQRFLIALPAEGAPLSTPLTVHTDWQAR